MLSDVTLMRTIVLKRNPKRRVEAGWTISRSRVNLPCHLILAVSVEGRISAVWEDHLK